MSSKETIGLACNGCGKPIGRVCEDEFNAIITGEFGQTLCFDCHPIEASHRPEIFEGLAEDDTIFIDGFGFHIEADKMFCFTRAHGCTHAHTRARVSSSYTYLNRTTKIREILENGLEIKICPACDGKGMFTEFGETFACASCDGVGALSSAIVLPSWILGLGCENV